MNVSLQRNLFAVFILLLVPLLSRAQTVSLESFEDQAVNYTFQSVPNDPSILQLPINGTVEIIEESPFNYVLTYQPTIGFLGTDFIRIVVWNSPVQWEYRNLEITVIPAKVDANPDYVTTYLNQSVDIDVTANDFSSNGVKNLTYIPLTNNGSVDFQPGESIITFTPDPDFEGVASFNYVICDGMETCDQGSVSVSVIGESMTESDTLIVYTTVNKPQVVVVPSMFYYSEGPFNGDYDIIDGIPTYTPDQDFVGTDQILFDNNGVHRLVQIEVLDIKENVLAFDDEVYTTPGAPIEFNVLENDQYGILSGCFSITSTPRYGNVVDNNYPRGSLTYTPPPGFTGVDFFTYTANAPNCPEEAETATVFVFVSNFEPTATTFRMFTPKRTPLIIGNNVPVTNFDYQIQDQAELGTAEIYAGQQNVTIYDQEISGYNMIIYTPNEDVDSGEDEFEISYCVMDNGVCQYTKTIKIKVEIMDVGDGEPQCFDDCVWMGDTNNDGIVNMEDLLPIGISMGEVGVPRPNLDVTQWYGRYGEDWEDPYDEGFVNAKYVDTDGDSLISSLDTTAISAFYGNTHSLVSARIPFYENEIVLRGNIFASPGDLVELDMIMGDEENPAVDVYGFTFPFNYNPNFFVPQSVSIEYGNDTWLAYNSPTLSMSRNNFDETEGVGLIETGFTRTSGVSATGLGKIGTVRFIVSDDINGFRPGEEEMRVTVGGGSASMMNSAGQTLGVNVGSATIVINLKPDEEVDENMPISEDLLKVYPNPTQSIVNVHLNGGNEFERVVIYNLTGQQMYDSGNIKTNHKRVNVHQFGNGLYYMSVYTKTGVISKKFEVVK
jgi:hypothetical protein